MRHLFTFLLCVAFIATVNAQGSITVIGSDGSNSFYAEGISSNGTYITGVVSTKLVSVATASREHHVFVWKKGTGAGTGLVENDINKLASVPNQRGSSGLSVSPTGLVSGSCPHPDYQYYDPRPAGERLFENSNVPIAALFDYGTQNWNFLPVVFTSTQNQFLVTDCSPRAYGISDDNKMVVGCQSPGGEATVRYVAGYWKESATAPGTYAYTALRNDGGTRGSVAKAVSGDGLVIGGFYSENNVGGGFTPLATLWISSNGGSSYTRTSLRGVSNGSVEGVSNDGKYVAVSVLKDDDLASAYLYEVDDRTLTAIYPQGSAAALAVSNNGVVVGHYGGLFYGGQLSNYAVSPIRHIADAVEGGGAFIFTKRMGHKPLKDFFDESGITYPAGFQFKAATGISADGRTICGHGRYNGKDVSFYAEIPDINGYGIFSATDFFIESPAYGSILLRWEGVPYPEDPNFVGYKIYRSNNTTTPIATTTETSYRIDNLTDGQYGYYVVSSYNTKDADKTKTLSYSMGKKAMPIYEPFDVPTTIQSLTNQYWNISNNTVSDSWFFDDRSGIPVGCLKFVASLGAYEESITTPYLDLTGSSKLRLIFNYTIYGTGDFYFVDVFDGENWSLLDELTDRTYGFKNKIYDLDQYAGKNNVRFRFRVAGEGGSGTNFFIDNIEISDENSMFIPEPPLSFTANYYKDEKKIHLSWSDPRGFASLRYTVSDSPADVVNSIGNEGIPFIAANMWPAADLKGYSGYKLTSISFMRGVNPEGSPGSFSEPKFKWFVSQGEERLYDQDVDDPVMGEWKTVQLDEPITIDISKPLYYGVEVVEHDPDDWPCATGLIWKEDTSTGMILYFGVPLADGRANLLSYDSGNSWEKLSTHYNSSDYTPAQQELYMNDFSQVFLLRATLAKDPAAQQIGRLNGYHVFRDGENLLGLGNLTSLNSYTDTIIPSSSREVCYTIRSIYATIPSVVKDACITIDVASLPYINDSSDNELKVFPNPIKKGETITVDTPATINGKVKIFDATGKEVKTLSAKGKTLPIPMDVEQGVYFLKINNETVKLIVE
ncbi:MAG: T9SS type A sorting domain-containing protein [Dysgonamonadaceae bacterium]|jgi:uncharacterized membrane protein|nr:T9SS type A sorting domain-containing protein [Dysgonamonadaceae bacterium]